MFVHEGGVQTPGISRPATLELDLQPGEDARFSVINKPGFGTYAMMAVIGAGPVYLVFERL